MVDPVDVGCPVLHRDVPQIGQDEFRLLPGVGEDNGLFVQRHPVQVFKMLALARIHGEALSVFTGFLETLYKEADFLPARFADRRGTGAGCAGAEPVFRHLHIAQRGRQANPARHAAGQALQALQQAEHLYAAGETSCNGVHGKNRLASNSLLESLVFSRLAARDIVRRRHGWIPSA